MLLVFALAAALCLRVFVVSSRLSVAGETASHAATAVQNAAETIKLCRGDMQKHAQIAGGSLEGENWQINYNEEWKPAEDEKTAFTVGVTPKDDDDRLLGSALVWARDEDGETLFQVTVCWQEENDG